MKDNSALPDLDESVAGDFEYREFFECSESWNRTRVNNIPKLKETFSAIKQLAETILLPVRTAMSRPVLTFGFCSQELQRQIPSGISPSHDQHAGYELNSRGNRICERGGIACDFYIPEMDSLTLSKWVVQNTSFDRLYFYGADRPIHVSVNEYPIAQIVTMTTTTQDGRRMPRVIKTDRFLELTND